MDINRIARQLSYANVMATLGVFIALGGASYAAVSLPAHSVGAKQLKRNAVTASTLKPGAVGSAKVKNGSLQRADFANGTLLEGPQGDPGPKGDPGPQGVPGPFPDALPSGKTVSGAFDVEGSTSAGGQVVTGGVSYLYPVQGQHYVHYVKKGTTDPNCPAASPPKAAPGHTCVYERYVINTTQRGINFAEFSGLGIYSSAVGPGAFGVRGTWAATAE